MNRRPLVVDIKRYCLHDGPGIRSVVFFKGCPLRCIFCHNPEAQEIGPEMAFLVERCINCGACVKECQHDALNLAVPGRISRDKCNLCGKCAEVCPTDALRLIGNYYSVESLFDILIRDFDYYRHSGGGVTISGGECTLFPNYLSKLLNNLKNRGIHIVLETSGYFDYGSFQSRILPYLDLIYYDIKLADDEAHQRYCGKPNTIILENFRRLITESDVEVHSRVPLAPGITDTEENLSAIAGLLRKYGVKRVWPIPYNPLGLVKFQTLGRRAPKIQPTFMKQEQEQKVLEILKKTSLNL